jgi:hypothetical protein
MQHLDRVQDQRHAALVVGDAGAVHAIAVHAVRLAGQDARLVDRVHVGDQHDALAALANETAGDDVVLALHRSAQCIQAFLAVVGHARHAGGIAAARFHQHQILQCRQQRFLLSARRVQQTLIGRMQLPQQR